MKKKLCKKLMVMVLVISMLIPLINYYKTPEITQGKQASKPEKVTENKGNIKEEKVKVKEKEDFSNSPVLKYVNEENFNKKGHIKRLKDE